ncbi:MAG: four helix bundle protein [Bacteroidetes bacterium]|nr:four helix bundle protein [Bacteroidota bacterium]
MHKLNKLKIWQKAVDLAVKVYEATEKFPREETYGLTSQIRRAVVSIASNIAEGAGRNSRKEFVRFLAISNGSAYELQTQVIISNKLGLMNDEIMKPLLCLIEEIQKMNYGLQNALR